MLVGDAGGRGGCLHIVDVGLHEFLAPIFDRTDTDDRSQRNDRAAHHRLLEILRVIFRKRGDLLLEQLQLDVRTRLKAVEPLAHIGKKARLGEFPVRDDVDAAIDLFAYDVGDRGAQRLPKGLFVVRLPGIFRLHHIEQPMRPRQAADMRGLDAVGILLQLHGWLPNRAGRVAGRLGALSGFANRI